MDYPDVRHNTISLHFFSDVVMQRVLFTLFLLVAVGMIPQIRENQIKLDL